MTHTRALPHLASYKHPDCLVDTLSVWRAGEGSFGVDLALRRLKRSLTEDCPVFSYEQAFAFSQMLALSCSVHMPMRETVL